MIHSENEKIYDRLKALTSEERLEVLSWGIDNEMGGNLYYSSKLIVQCIKVVSPDGWKELAPSWEKGWREECKKKGKDKK